MEIHSCCIKYIMVTFSYKTDINPNPSHGNEDLFRGSEKRSESLQG
jgi:hypothetical protein